MRIAFLACPETLPGSPVRRPDAFEHDRYLAALRTGIRGRAEIIDIDWRAPIAELAQFDCAILGTPWDYTEAKDEFLAKLAMLEAAGVAVRNPLEVVRWNADKLYLRELAERGVVTIPTLWLETADTADIVAAFAHFRTDRIVVKRRIGAGAIGQASFRRDDPLPRSWRMDQPTMIQPFLPAIQHEGEYSFVFVGGHFSHPLVKHARPGEYRIQSLYGGTETALDPDPDDAGAAQAIMALLPFGAPPLYARIDMVRLEDGRLALIEAELIEPYLYPDQGPRFGEMLADAVIALQ